MQLSDPKGGALAAAALALVGGTTQAQAADGKRWEFDTAMLIYTEGADRVSAFEPKLTGALGLGNDRHLTAGVTLDVLTGASPNGAIRSTQPQTFTSPSGNATFTAEPGELPLDPSFKDTRVAVDLGFDTPVGERNKVGFHVNGSTEYDYLSIGGGVSASRDFNLRNTTLSAGVNYAQDSINPVGGTPTPLAIKTGSGGGADETKQVVDGLLGVTQVLSAVSLVQVNYAVSRSTGYQTDPYKIVSVVDTNGEPLRYVFEGRPDSRLKHAGFVEYKRFVFDRDVFEASYRYMTDDWGIVSHTLDTTYRWNFAGSQYLEPHLRWYRQGSADFYTAALDDGQESAIQYASADPRLGAFNGLTGGLKYGRTSFGNYQWSARLEYYKQVGSAEKLPSQAAAALSKFDLAPDLNVVMLTLGLRFGY